MRMTTPRLTLPGLALLLLAGSQAAAQPAPTQTAPAQPTPEAAALLEGQVTAWLAAVTGGVLALPTRPVQLTADGDHYAVRVPLAPSGGSIEPADAAFTGTLRQLDANRWALDDQHFPPDLTITTTETVPDSPDAKDPSPNGSHPVPVTYHVVLGQQEVRGVFDTNLLTPSTTGGSLASIDIARTGGAGDATTHLGVATTQTSITAVDPSHSDVASDIAGQAYATSAALPDGSVFTWRAERVHVATALSGLAQGQLVPLLRLASGMAALVKPPGSDDADGATPEQKAKLHAMLAAANRILTGARIDQAVEGVQFDLGGTAGSLSKAEISLGGEAPADSLSASAAIVLDGLVIDALPPELAAYVPTHFAIHPTLSNLDLAALTAMGMDATAPVPEGARPPEVDGRAAFGKGGLRFGFDGLVLDVAGAELTGTGRFTITGDQSVTGQADLSAHGLDSLIAKAQEDPMLRSAVPVIIFLKGIAHTTGDLAVWQVTLDDANVLVNGVDLSAIAGPMRR